MINIVNKYKHVPTDSDIYIGRGSILGNPYTSINNRATKAKYVVESKEVSISFFETYLREKIKSKDSAICNELNKIWKMAKRGGINLVCYCHPNRCHGEVVKKIVEEKL